MRTCDVLIVGGGPAGSTCAWRLARAGAQVVVIDRARFPRQKPCAGWITPRVLETLELEPEGYAAGGRTLQPIDSFLTGRIGGPALHTSFGRTVSYGILRREFDHYLLARSGADVLEAEPLASLRRAHDSWIANEQILAPVIVGAGGHHCPVARWLNDPAPVATGTPLVLAQFAEWPMDSAEAADCRVDPAAPELYFCEDFAGYGWCFRKGDTLNVGLGRLDPHGLTAHVRAFADDLRRRDRLGMEPPARWIGHAYVVGAPHASRTIAEGLLLAGDAAGLARPQSGEGIGPAVESGLLAAETLIAAGCRSSIADLEPYADAIRRRFHQPLPTDTLSRLAPRLRRVAARHLLSVPWFARTVVLEHLFLHAA